MGYSKDIKNIIEYCKISYSEIELEYAESLKNQSIHPFLSIKIKNFMENIRSALDYSAHDIFDKYGNGSKVNPKIYFPYALISENAANFPKRINNGIPGIPSTRSDIFSKLSSYQHFKSKDNLWLPAFMKLNNENKHWRLTPQTRVENKELIMHHKNGSRIVLGVGASLNVLSQIKIGNTVMPGRTISVDNPLPESEDLKNEIKIWYDFHFSTTNEPVLELLKKALEGTERITDELGSI